MLALRCTAPALGLVAVLALSACAPPAPAAPPSASPTPTAFASDEEAFRAAEETYRAYVDALNNVDLADPETFEPVYALTTGDVREEDVTTLTRYHADGLSVSGDTVVASVLLDEATKTSVTIIACIDVSSVLVVDAAGSSLVQPDRDERQQLRVEARLEPSAQHQAVLTKVTGAGNDSTC